MGQLDNILVISSHFTALERLARTHFGCHGFDFRYRMNPQFLKIIDRERRRHCRNSPQMAARISCDLD